ncbi:MAG: hypothetical protein GXY83_35675, partial [Rhodopirellula sp.]|nr:hypothetical protein [Rhodopirellula sp.]
QMLAKAPQDRPASPSAVIDTLAPFCEGSKLIGLLREARRKEQAAAGPEASRVVTGELRGSMEVETSRDVPAMSPDLEHADHGAEIDPYHVWLGIPREEQPPDHYRLLGIARFEANAEVIRDAAARQMAHVRTYHLGQHAELSQRILNELAAAKACLLNPAKKTAYDAKLREQQQAAERKVLPDGPPDLPDWLATHAQTARSLSAPPARLWSRLPPAKYAIAATGVAGILILLGIVMSVSTAKGRVKIVLNDPQAEVEMKVDGEKVEIAGLGEPLVLRPGEHELTVTGPKYEAVGRSFTVRRGDTALLEISLVPLASASPPPRPLTSPGASTPADKQDLAEAEKEVADVERNRAEEERSKAETKPQRVEGEKRAADVERERVQTEKKVADLEKKLAEERTKAEMERERAEQNFYQAQIGLSYQNITSDFFAPAETLLDACPIRLRNWEWGYLKRLCHLELLAISGSGDFAFSPDGKRLATRGRQGGVTIWDAATGQTLLTLIHGGKVTSVAFSPDGNRLASGGEDKMVRI